MQDINNLNTILTAISTIDNKIIASRNISLEDLKLLTLINFNECLRNNDPDPLIKSYLTVAFDHIISIENENQQVQFLPKEEQKTPVIVEEKSNEIPNTQLKFENEIIQKMIHERAPRD